MIVCPAAIIALATGVVVPRTDFTWPWAIVPIPAFVLVIWLAKRYRERLRRHGGWRRVVANFFDAVHLVYTVLTSPRRHGPALAGMADLRPALSWRTSVTLAKRVGAGEAISYGLRYRLDRESTIATVTSASGVVEP